MQTSTMLLSFLEKTCVKLDFKKKCQREVCWCKSWLSKELFSGALEPGFLQCAEMPRGHM